MGRYRSLVAVVLVVAGVAAACGGEEDLPASGVLTAAPTQPAATEAAPPATTSPVGGTTLPTSAPETTPTVPSLDGVAVPPSLEGLPLTLISVNDELLIVAVADNSGARQQGLMNVEDLVDLDGMLFTWPNDTEGGFWMKNTLLPLDIAFFGAEGSLVDTFPMEPCTESPCPLYIPAGAYRYALETEQGRLGTLPPASSLDFVAARDG